MVTLLRILAVMVGGMCAVLGGCAEQLPAFYTPPTPPPGPVVVDYEKKTSIEKPQRGNAHFPEGLGYSLAGWNSLQPDDDRIYRAGEEDYGLMTWGGMKNSAIYADLVENRPEWETWYFEPTLGRPHLSHNNRWEWCIRVLGCMTYMRTTEANTFLKASKWIASDPPELSALSADVREADAKYVRMEGARRAIFAGYMNPNWAFLPKTLKIDTKDFWLYEPTQR